MGILKLIRNEDERYCEAKEVEKNDILQQINKLSKDLNYAYEKYDLLSEEVLIDSQIYEIKAIQLKYHYLLNKAKELGIIVKEY